MLARPHDGVTTVIDLLAAVRPSASSTRPPGGRAPRSRRRRLGRRAAAHALPLPVTPAEVWGAGVTYKRSADFREEGTGIYDRVYVAPRPELFFKATAVALRRARPGDRPPPRLDLHGVRARDGGRDRRLRRDPRLHARERRVGLGHRARQPAVPAAVEDATRAASPSAPSSSRRTRSPTRYALDAALLASPRRPRGLRGVGQHVPAEAPARRSSSTGSALEPDSRRAPSSRPAPASSSRWTSGWRRATSSRSSARRSARSRTRSSWSDEPRALRRAEVARQQAARVDHDLLQARARARAPSSFRRARPAATVCSVADDRHAVGDRPRPRRARFVGVHVHDLRRLVVERDREAQPGPRLELLRRARGRRRRRPCRRVNRCTGYSRRMGLVERRRLGHRQRRHARERAAVVGDGSHSRPVGATARA